MQSKANTSCYRPQSPLPKHVSFTPVLRGGVAEKRKELETNTFDRLANDSEMPQQGVSECDDNEGLSNKYEECLLNQSIQPSPSFTDERYWLF